MERPSDAVGDAVTKCCLDCFSSLPKRGKPADEREWTILAGFVLKRTEASGRMTYSLASLATGTKSRPPSMMCKKGEVLNDCHAEVAAKRAFQLFLWRELQRYLAGESGTVLRAVSPPARIPARICDGLEVYLYVSQTPCGDASIFPVDHVIPASSYSTGMDKTGDSSGSKRHKRLAPAIDAAISKRTRTTETNLIASTSEWDDERFFDQRTGARLASTFAGGTNNKAVRHLRQLVHALTTTTQQPRNDALTVGAARTKPGRGEQTLSMSCSDKIALWNVVGLQGALLALFLHPVYLHSVVVGDLFNGEALKRALVRRVLPLAGVDVDEALPAHFKVNEPCIQHTTLQFERSKVSPSRSTGYPSGWTISWTPYHHEVVAGKTGKRAGANKRNWDSPKVRCSVRLSHSLVDIELTALQRPDPTGLCEAVECDAGCDAGSGVVTSDDYATLKERACAYRLAKRLFRELPVFSHWITPEKSTYEMFLLDPSTANKPE